MSMPHLANDVDKHCSVIRSFALAVATTAMFSWAATTTASDILGPDWDEDVNGGGDAGDKPQSAQKVILDTTDTVAKITGKLKGDDSGGSLAGDLEEGDFQDVYEIVIKNPGQFSISTVPPQGDTEFNSVLCVYDFNGLPLLANIDADQGTQGSRVGNVSSSGKFQITEPGAVYISISGNGSFPLNSTDAPLFSFNDNPVEIVGPTPDGGQDPLDKWTAPGPIGAYVITLTAVGPFPTGCGAENTQSCGFPHALPYCNDVPCCTAVCAVDPFCCDVRWDASCVQKAFFLCNSGEGGCGSPATLSCFELHKEPFCNDPECCAKVCAQDPSCCDQSWDSSCVSLANELCQQPCNPKCPPDLNFDGIVNGADLTLMLGSWGQRGCGDLDGSGQVDGADLTLLLGGWGNCQTDG